MSNLLIKNGKDGAGAVIVISSHVARGSVGNRAIVFALEALGFPVWSVPTILLPWHPGHGPATRIVPGPEQFSSFMRDLERAPWLGEVVGVLSGYLGSSSQADAVAHLVARVKERNPKALYLCDPVMGDKGGLYVPQDTAIALRDCLMPLADIATPNRYELEWMAGATLADTRATVDAARNAAPSTMLVTSAPAEAPGNVANLLVTGEQALRAEHRLIAKAPNGTGDVTSALFLARLLQGASPTDALAKATASVLEVLERAAERGADELMLETDAQCLIAPKAEMDPQPLTSILPAS